MHLLFYHQIQSRGTPKTASIILLLFVCVRTVTWDAKNGPLFIFIFGLLMKLNIFSCVYIPFVFLLLIAFDYFVSIFLRCSSHWFGVTFYITTISFCLMCATNIFSLAVICLLPLPLAYVSTQTFKIFLQSNVYLLLFYRFYSFYWFFFFFLLSFQIWKGLLCPGINSQEIIFAYNMKGV